MGFKFSEIFTFLKENKLYAKVRAKVADVLADKKDELVAYVEEYLKEKSPVIKSAVIDFLMENVKFGFPYNLFKGRIKKIIDKNFDRLIEFILAKLQEI
jgi:hypothetical protein